MNSIDNYSGTVGINQQELSGLLAIYQFTDFFLLAIGIVTSLTCLNKGKPNDQTLLLPVMFNVS